VRRAVLRLVVAALLTATACTGNDPGPGPDRVSLPPIALDPCPAAAPAGSGGGKRLPDLTLDCIGDGPDVALRALPAVPYVLNLWASWCGPCAREMPDLQKVYAKAAGRVGFLGVNTMDRPVPARETIQARAVRYPSVADPEEKVRAHLLDLGYQTVGMPITVLVDKEGVIAAVLIGERTAAELETAIRESLGVTL
jgi:cytochrome c biogenesis protein CcmG, thiol:disulfide interchange protein DsbE